MAVSYELIGYLESYRSNHNPYGEASRRVIIDAIIGEAMKITGHSNNRKLNYETQLRLYGVHDNKLNFHEGKVDYSIGSDENGGKK